MRTYKKVSHRIGKSVAQRIMLGGIVAAGLALSVMAQAVAETLLIVHPETDTLEWVDPGSGLRLASVTVGNRPRWITAPPVSCP